MRSSKLTKNARAFVDANNNSPVVEGAVLSYETGGGYYKLKNGKEFRLSRDECRSLPDNYPFWYLPGEN